MVRKPARVAAAALVVLCFAGELGADEPGALPRGDGFTVFRWLAQLGLGELARERLVGHGGRWEQAAIACERPLVHLSLERDEPKFALEVDAHCRGQAHRAAFSGRWEGRGHDRLVLVFVADDGEEESLTCPIRRCDDGSREDCIFCEVAPDLAFELRVVRR